MWITLLLLLISSLVWARQGSHIWVKEIPLKGIHIQYDRVQKENEKQKPKKKNKQKTNKQQKSVSKQLHKFLYEYERTVNVIH